MAKTVQNLVAIMPYQLAHSIIICNYFQFIGLTHIYKHMVLQAKRFFGSKEGNEVAGFLVFSQ